MRRFAADSPQTGFGEASSDQERTIGFASASVWLTRYSGIPTVRIDNNFPVAGLLATIDCYVFSLFLMRLFTICFQDGCADAAIIRQVARHSHVRTIKSYVLHVSVERSLPKSQNLRLARDGRASGIRMHASSA